MVGRAIHESKQVEEIFGFYFSWFWVGGTPIILSKNVSWYTFCSAFLIINCCACLGTIVADIFVIRRYAE
ncbi:hypothetical protein L9F63_002391, partial [Diploptera punctata]